MTTSLCKLPCTQQNKLFPFTLSDGLFICSQSGKQIHIILIQMHVCFHILMVYTLTVAYMPTLYFRLVSKRYSSCKMFGLIHLQRFIPELKLHLFHFKKKHTLCTGERLLASSITNSLKAYVTYICVLEDMDVRVLWSNVVEETGQLGGKHRLWTGEHSPATFLYPYSNQGRQASD